MHLHHGYRLGPRIIAGVTLGISLCGARKLKPQEFTIDKAAVTCKACLTLAKHEAEQAAATPQAGPPVGPSPVAARVGKAKAGNVTSGHAKPVLQGTITLLVAHNPRKRGSAKWERFEVVRKHSGQSVAAYLQAGGNAETLANAVKDHLVKLEP